MDAIIIQPRGDPWFAAIQALADDAYAAAQAADRSAFDAYLNTSTALQVQASVDVWLCPCCRKVLTPVDTLCVYCESDERDCQDEMQSHGHLRHAKA